MRLPVTDRGLFEALHTTLQRGGVVIMPCDTVYGLVGIAPDTEPRLRRIKGRGEKSFLQLIPSLDSLGAFTDRGLPESLRRYWPGALTVIFPVRADHGPERPSRDLPGSASVALRVPNDPLLVKLMEKLERSLFSTSVNRAGEPPLWRIRDILECFERRVDLVVDGGDRQGGVASTIVDITASPFRVLRRGAVELPPESLGPESLLP